MRGSALNFRGRTAAFFLFAIVAAIFFRSQLFDQYAQPDRLHPRDLRQQVNVSDHYAQPLVPRLPVAPTTPATAEQYAHAARKGQTLMCWMRDPTLADHNAISKATRFEQLDEWGWTTSVFGTNYIQETDPGLKALVGTEWGNGNRVLFAHTKAHEPVEENGKTYKYPATLANYDNRFFHKQGVIIADSNWSSVFNIEMEQIPGWDKEVDRKPEVNQLSDIWWLIWAKICANVGTDPSTLRYIVQKSVVNDDSQAVLASVLQKHWSGETEVDAGRAPEWPGKVIKNNMDGFAALVGTPNIWGSAYLAVQRSEILGKKQIKSITVWNGYPDSFIYQPNMIVELEDVVDDAPEE